MRCSIVIALVIVLSILGCSSGTDMPSTPDVMLPEHSGEMSNRALLGFWQGIIDPDGETIDFVKMRETSLHLNALVFLESPPLVNVTLDSLEFNGDVIEADIGLRHPFTGLDQFTGFDVCGLFISNGSVNSFADTDLVMSGEGETRLLNPDGYSRWWNPSEFPVNDGTIFSYNDGLLGTPDSIADFNNTLNGYKYFCDDLDDPNDPMTDVTQAKRGLFSAGQKNVRHYTIKLGTSGLIFNYAIDACWQFPKGSSPWTVPDDFGPNANRPEAWNISVTEVTNTLWNDGNEMGGNLTLSIDVYDWFNPGLNTVRVESPGNFTLTESATPVGGGEGYSTYQIEITDATPAEDSIDLLVSVVNDTIDYGGFLPGKPVTAYFTQFADVSGEPVQNVTGWVRTWGAGGQDRGYDVEVDSQGDIYISGFFYYNCDFDPGDGDDFHNSNGNRDSFISKFDPEGNHLWAATWGGDVEFGGMAMDCTIDHSDNVLVTGYFYGLDVDFDPGLGEDLHSSHHEPGTWGSDCYVTKFDPDGNHLWAQTWGGSDWNGDSALGVAVDSLNNIYVSAGYRGTCDFDPGDGEDIHSSQGGYRDASLSSFTSDGDYRWSKQWGGTYDDYTYGAVVDGNDDVHITGKYNYDCDFDPGPGEDWYNATTDGGTYYSKFDSDGNYIRVRVFTAGYPFRLAVDSLDNIYLSGVFSGTGQFDPDGVFPEIIANGDRDCHISKFNSAGDFQWVRTWDSIATGDGTGGYVGCYVTIDDSDYIYSTGHFTSTADLDPDPVEEDNHISGGGRDAFVTKFDPTGDHIWSRTWGGESLEDGAGIAVDSTGNVYSSGYYYSDETDFDPGLGEYYQPQNGNGDAFLIKLNSDGYWE